LKIALFVHCFFPNHFYGTETYTLELARNFQRLGHEVTVVAGIFQGEEANDATLSSYSYEGIDVIAFDKNHVPHSRIAETYFQEAARPHLRQIIAQIKPDIIHVTHLINHTAVLLEEAKYARVPIVATLTDFFGFCFNNKLEAADGSLCVGPNKLRSNCISCYVKASNHPIGDWVSALPLGWPVAGLAIRIANRLGADYVGDGGASIHDLIARPDVLKQAYENYDAMIAPSRFLYKSYSANGFDERKLHLSHFGVDLDRRPKPKRTPNSPITIGYVGQIAPHKGVDLLVSAVRDFSASVVRLNIYGPENQDPAYMKKLREMGGENIHFCGTFAPSRMADVMAEFDLLAIPSTWYENSPLVLLNALASHTPVIVSDVEGLTEFIEEGVSGWSFKRADAASLRSLLGRLLEDPDVVRASAGKTSYERTPLSMTEDLLAVYEKVGICSTRIASETSC
jgi:glycosyltransferase involved in cell wall biosynthesis